MSGDPNVSALSSEVEGLVKDAAERAAYACARLLLDRPNLGSQYVQACVNDVTGRLRELVRKALGTVEAKLEAAEIVSAELIAEHNRLPDLREQARALAEALRESARYLQPEIQRGPASEHWSKAVGLVTAALASWDTSQKESR